MIDRGGVQSLRALLLIFNARKLITNLSIYIYRRKFAAKRYPASILRMIAEQVCNSFNDEGASWKFKATLK